MIRKSKMAVRLLRVSTGLPIAKPTLGGTRGLHFLLQWPFWSSCSVPGSAHCSDKCDITNSHDVPVIVVLMLWVRKW